MMKCTENPGLGRLLLYDTMKTTSWKAPSLAVLLDSVLQAELIITVHMECLSFELHSKLHHHWLFVIRSQRKEVMENVFPYGTKFKDHLLGPAL